MTRSTRHVAEGALSFGLVESMADGNTLNLSDRIALGIKDELIALPTGNRGKRTVLTVSKKEVLYAMMQSGRASVFGDHTCDLQALVDQVGIRQNTVAWAESLIWKWPNGHSARWNPKYWNRGNPVKGYPLHEAINDAFVQQERYAIGCYTATKLVVIQGVLDYYRRIKKDPETLGLVTAQLMKDNDPLTHIEPGSMWSFESDVTQADMARAGKLLVLQHGISSKNFIPGDWSYFLNTDPITYKKTGYEGSNALYLGRDRFDDYYNDHNHAYSYKEKIHEVYQWRNKVFSASRDVAKVKPLTMAEIERLSTTPERGGVQLDLRAVPLLFGYQEMPFVSP
jgi:hypothetical protein